jgi:hypothetical protein
MQHTGRQHGENKRLEKIYLIYNYILNVRNLTCQIVACKDKKKKANIPQLV